MSLDKMEQYRKNKANRGGGYQSGKEQADLKRDTVCAIIVILILIFAPIGITIYQSQKNAAQQAAQEEFIRQLQEQVASASNASSSTAESASDASGESAADGSQAAAGDAAGSEGAAVSGESAANANAGAQAESSAK